MRITGLPSTIGLMLFNVIVTLRISRLNTLVVYVRPPGSRKPTPPVLSIEQCGVFLGGPNRECGAGVYLFWSHSPDEEEEGLFFIEKGIWESDICRWSGYRGWIPSDQRHLFVPISEFLNTNVSFRMHFIHITLPLETGEVELIRVGFNTVDADWSSSESVCSNIVGIATIAPPVLLRVYEEPLICKVCFRWTTIEMAEEYEYEVSDDNTFSNRERVHSDRKSAREEDYEEGNEYYDILVGRFGGPLATIGCVYIDSDLPGARVIYVRVRSRRVPIHYSNWSNVLFYQIPEE